MLHLPAAALRGRRFSCHRLPPGGGVERLAADDGKPQQPMDDQHRLAAAYWERTGKRHVPADLAARREQLHRHGTLINGKPATHTEAALALARATTGQAPHVQRRPGGWLIAPARRATPGRATPRPRTSHGTALRRRGSRRTTPTRAGPDDPDGDPEPVGPSPRACWQTTGAPTSTGGPGRFSKRKERRP